MARHIMFIGKKMALLPKFIYGFSAFPVKFSTVIFCSKICKLILKFIKLQGTQNGKMVIRKKNRVREFTFLNFHN